MAALNFPPVLAGDPAPTVGQVFNNYQWDGQKWISNASGPASIGEPINDGQVYARKGDATWKPTILKSGDSIATVNSFGNQTLVVSPTANYTNIPASRFETYASLSMQTTTVKEDRREFAANFGLESTTGNALSGDPQNNGKVTVYAGAYGRPGTGDLWALNTVVTAGAGSGVYKTHGYELDVNNYRGPADIDPVTGAYPNDYIIGFAIAGVPHDPTDPSNPSWRSTIASHISGAFCRGYSVFADINDTLFYGASTIGSDYGLWLNGGHNKRSIRVDSQTRSSFNGSMSINLGSGGWDNELAVPFEVRTNAVDANHPKGARLLLRPKVSVSLTNGSALMSCNDDNTGQLPLEFIASSYLFSGAAPVVSLATMPAAADSSTKVPTTAWVQSAIAAGGSGPGGVTDNELLALAGTTAAANQLPYFDSATTAATTTLTSLARDLLGGTTATAMRTTIGAASNAYTPTGGGGISATSLNAAITELDNEKFDKTGGALTGGIGIHMVTGGANIVLNKATSTTDSAIFGQMGGNTRWLMRLGDFTPEGSGNAGSNFALERYDDAGTTKLGTPISINRSTGVTTFDVQPAMPGAALTKGTDDTNITLTLGGTPASALLKAASITAAWAGTLQASRGGFGMSVAASTGVPLFATGTPTFTPTIGTGDFVRAISPTLTGTIAAAAMTLSGALTATGSVLISGTSGAIGYAAGAGSVGTQAGAQTNAISINRLTGQLSLVAAVPSTTTWVTFQVNNANVIASDCIVINQRQGTNLYEVVAHSVGTNLFKVSFRSISGVASEAPLFNYAVIKAVAS